MGAAEPKLEVILERLKFPKAFSLVLLGLNSLMDLFGFLFFLQVDLLIPIGL